MSDSYERATKGLLRIVVIALKMGIIVAFMFGVLWMLFWAVVANAVGK